VDGSRDVEDLVKQLLDGATPEEGRALLEAMLKGQVSSIFEKLDAKQLPSCGRLLWRFAGSGFAWTSVAQSHRSGDDSICPAT
jgi:hypothetical protein